MPAFRYSKEGKKNYLLLPTMPTPNGGLHLGHISGPYLKMDVMAKAHRRNGSIASVMCGSDVYESYTTLKSWQTGKEVEEICHHFHQRIREDLIALQINCDAFINPLDPEHHQHFNEFMRNAVYDCMDKAAAVTLNEEFLFAPGTGNYLAGCWITGLCPVCGKGSGSYQCEECGTHYRPMDLIGPVFRKGTDHELVSVSDQSLYLTVKDPNRLLAHLDTMNLHPEFIKIVRTYLENQGAYIRLTNPDNWGTSVEIPGSKTPQVVFTYTALYFFGVYLGHIFKKLYNSKYHAFHPLSGVTTVASFGIDCSIPYMIGSIAAGMETGSYKPTDYFLPNQFFHLEGSKFSTSRGHAIWGNDIVHKTPATSDAVRFFLVLENPENEKKDFRIDAFIRFVNEELTGSLQPLLQQHWHQLSQREPGAAPEKLTEQLDLLLQQQLHHLTPPSFDLLKSTGPLQEWIQSGGEEQNAYWWLKGFSLLAWPIMPDCAAAIWKKLGCTGNPEEKDFFDSTTIQTDLPMPVFFHPISWESLKPALPATLEFQTVNE